ncbi:MAG: anthranilate synthase component II [Gemmatimonadales bacterium]
MIVLLDHDDSFVHTLASYVAELSASPEVISARATTAREILAAAPFGIVLSPGPGRPEDCPVALELLRTAPAALPILGVCLGHQCVALAFGAAVTRAPTPRHGMVSAIHHDHAGVFAGLPDPFLATRYHSLAVHRESLPDSLCATATADDGVLMGVRHRVRRVEGIQFHPESVLTSHGHAMLANFFDLVDARRR